MVSARAAAKAPPPDVRVRVLAAATKLFAAHGFDGTPLQDVADAVGVTKPAILHHFPSKEDLRRAVLEAMLEHWNATLPRLLLAASAGEGRFDAVMGELVSFFTSDPDRARLLVREVLDRPEEAKALLTQSVKPWLSAIASYIEKGKKHGEHHEDADPEVYVLHVLLLVISAVAVEGSFHVLVPAKTEAAARERYVAELKRLAKSSLFVRASSEAAEANEKEPPKKPLRRKG
jgi:TetR/AcrR family transcriptional regulator